jgi:hypothetical protein
MEVPAGVLIVQATNSNIVKDTKIIFNIHLINLIIPLLQIVNDILLHYNNSFIYSKQFYT